MIRLAPAAIAVTLLASAARADDDHAVCQRAIYNAFFVAAATQDCPRLDPKTVIPDDIKDARADCRARFPALRLTPLPAKGFSSF
jgi:hypothetical protein